MKKLFFTLCALCVSVSTWALQAGATAWTDSNRGEVYQDANNTGLYFYISGTDAVLTWSDASTSNYSSLSALTIPASVTYEGVEYPVTKIGDYAFYDAATIEGEVVIPANILNLGISAFENCTKISAVTIEYSETAITETNNQLYGCSFYGCSGINTITVNRDITVQRDSDSNQAYRVSPFTSLTGVVTVIFGEEVTKVPRNMCYGCANITTVNCYARTTPSLGTDSFNDINKESCTLHVCKSLLESYNETYWATQFTLIENDLPDSGLEEGTYCDVTTRLYFEINEDGTASIYHDELGVYDDNNLVSHSTITGAYTLPETVSADGETYYNVTRVEANAFESSSISGHIVIPAYITNIGAEAFKSCTQITEVTYEYSATEMSDENDGNSTGYTFTSCSGITKVNIYRDIKIGSSSRVCAPFAWQTAIATINIGPRVTTLPNYMFRQTSNNPIKTINCYGAVPPTLGTGVFDNLGSEYTVNVPQGAEEAYASSWSSYYTEGHTGNLSNAYAVAISLNNDDGYYATYYNSKAVDIYPEGGTENVVTSYAVSGVTVEDKDEGYLDLAEVGATVPAGTAVLVEATAEGTYTVIETTTATSASYTGTNDLYGYDTATAVTDNDSYYYYTLSHPADGGSLGFYWATLDGSASSFTSAAHKAYLMLLKSEVENLKSISLRKGDGGGDTTGITSVEVENEPNTVKGIYTIQGVRVSNMNQSGLYIVDGKKILMK